MNRLAHDLDRRLRQFYNSNTEYFEHMHRTHDARFYANMLHILERQGLTLEGKHILDIGSGAGNLLAILKRLYPHLRLAVGVDISSIGCGMHRHGCPVAGDASRLPFASSAFDIVLLVDVLEHVTCPCAVLCEAYRVTCSRGYILLRTQNYRCPVLSSSPMRDVVDLLRNLAIGHQPSLKEVRPLTPRLTSDVIGGDEDAVSAIWANAVKHDLEGMGGEALIYETWAGMGWRVPVLRVFNKVPVMRHLGGTCTILYWKHD